MSSDYAHRWTDKELAALERRIHNVYGDAAKELREEVDEYFETLKRRDDEMRALLAQKKITEQKYVAWRKAQIGRGQRVERLIDELSERITAVNGHAMEYVRDGMAGVYAENHNYIAYTIEEVHGNVGFTLYDEETVRRLLIADPDLFPAPSVDIPVDMKWNRTKLQDALIAGIIKGESLDKIADRMMAVTDMTEVAARRNARTAYTGAQNAGRQKAMERAAQMGINFRKRWVATKDMRTRHAHGAADGQVVPFDEPFDVDGHPMMYPGDRNAPGRLVYNCRCTMRTVDPIDEQLGPRQMRVRNPLTGKNKLVSEMTYAEWKAHHVKEVTRNV